MALIDRRDPAELTVYVQHRCPAAASGRIHGPYALATAWWAELGPDGRWRIHLTDESSRRVLEPEILAVLGGTADLRRHLDELAELPDVP